MAHNSLVMLICLWFKYMKLNLLDTINIIINILLTVYIQCYSFTNCWWYIVAGYTQIGSHLFSVQTPKMQIGAIVRIDWKQ